MTTIGVICASLATMVFVMMFGGAALCDCSPELDSPPEPQEDEHIELTR